jgi:membrane associated rhomboid family serine protease
MIPLRDDIESSKPPVVTTVLIAVNLVVYALQVLTGTGQEAWAWKFGLVPIELTRGVELTPGSAAPVMLNLFTSMFLHGGFWHLAGNMLYLWIFGDNVEDRMGHVRFLVFYVVCGLAAALFFVWTEPDLQVPLVGASGAIAGVLGAYLLSYPYARVATLIFFGFFIRVIHIPALVVLGLWFVLQLISGLPTVGANEGGGVAFLAHVGGFVAGMILLLPFSPRGDRHLRWRR